VKIKLQRYLKPAVITIFIIAIAFFLARKNNNIVRPEYQAESIVASPNGSCALVEYKFHGGERGKMIDPFPMLLMLEGDAFYMVVNLQSGKILRDSTTEIPAIKGLSLGLAGMGYDVFFWDETGTTAAFPGGEGPYHEWKGIQQCGETQIFTKFAGLRCHGDSTSQPCMQLIAMLPGKKHKVQ
jgi:hypothetical protein